MIPSVNHPKCLFLITALLALPAAAERVVCPAAADTWVRMPAWDRGAPTDGIAEQHGGDAELVISGRNSFALLAFDCAAARGMTVEKVVLRVHRRPDPVPLHTVGVSTISGNGPMDETANFFHARADRPWSYAGSDLVDVTFAQGGSLYTYARARDAGAGWWEIDLPPAMAHALITGDQFGLMLCDEKGQTQTRHVLSSREGGSPPALVLEGTRGDRTAPGPVRSLKPEPRAGRRAGSVALRFGGAGDNAGRGVAARYELRYSTAPVTAANFESATLAPRWGLDPLAPKPNPMAVSNSLRDEVDAVVEPLQAGSSYYFAARAYDAAGNAGPVSSLGRQRAFTRAFPALPEGAARTAGEPVPAGEGLRVWTAPELLKISPVTGEILEKELPHSGPVHLTGARNEFVAFQLALESRQPVAGIQVRVSKPLFAASKLPPVFQKNGGAIQLAREWFVPDENNRWYPDVLVPVEAPLEVPARDNAVPGQTVQPVFVDIYIPHDAAPGKHQGQLTVEAPGGFRREIEIDVEVLPLRLPDKLSFIVDLNCYSGVDSGYKLRRGTPEYRRLEQAYHRAAHLNRANLDVLGYSHNGSTVPDHAPPLAGEGAATRVASWADWDAHFGPLVDGSAFADLPRASEPIAAMYLPFFENWPGDLRKSYRFNDYPIAKTEEEYREIVTRHALTAAPVEEAFSNEYQERFRAVAADFAAHLEQKGWTKTRYLVYFNDKYYYKRPAQGGRGISWWLLDEPNHRDDVRAISFFAMLLKQGLARHPGAPIELRTDISRVEWIRDLLAGQIDLDCISRRFFDKNRYLLGDRRRFGRDFWNYASTNHPRESNVAMRAWCWRVWLNGGNGIVPWNTVRGAEAWQRAEPLTVFYPGTKFGKNEPFVSLRLKAYRRGEQDIEYLALLARKKGWDREAVARAVEKALDLKAEVTQTHEEDAGAIRFDNVRDPQFEELRLRVARALME